MSRAHGNSHGGSIRKQRMLTAAVGMALMLAADPAGAQGARTVADFNGDGVEDLAIGAPGANGGRGSVSIFLGVAGIGFPASTPTVTLIGRDAGEQFGFALAAADFNGNGRSELAVGVPDWNNSIGKVNVITFISWAAAGTLSSSALYIQNSVGGGTSAPNDRFGAALATGNFDGDRYPDLAIGVPGDDLNFSGTGSVNILYGSLGGLRIAHDPWWHHHALDGTARTGDGLGHALASGDFNADGGTRYYFDPGQGIHQNSYHVRDRSESGDGFGTSLTAGDVNGDGRADLAAGVPSEDMETTVTRPDAGAVAVLFGGTTALTPEGNVFLVGASRQTGARFGSGLAR